VCVCVCEAQVDNAHCVQVLLVQHWAQSSPSGLNHMKTEQLDHVAPDLLHQSTVAYTGTGPGDNALPRVAKIPFRAGSNKSKDQEALTCQLMSFGEPPTFLRVARHVHVQKRLGFAGDGASLTLNAWIVQQTKLLRKQGWDSVTCNLPNDAGVLLWRQYCQKRGVTVPYLEFTTYKIKRHHMVRVRDSELWASDSYHKAPCHDFVELVDRRVCRAVAFLKLHAPLGKTHHVLLEELELQDDAQLAKLGCAVYQEAERWFWVDLTALVRPVCALRHPSDQSFHFIIPDKHATQLWV